jgi:hypothetical protein
MPFTRTDVEVARHEADHAAALFILLGPDTVGSVTRVAAKTHLGLTKLGDLPAFRHPMLNASDLAVALLVPLLDPDVPDTGCSSDVKKAYEAAEIAYRYRPDHEKKLDADEWADQWVHGVVTDRARELLDSVRFRGCRRALERALDSSPTLDAAEVRRVLGG